MNLLDISLSSLSRQLGKKTLLVLSMSLSLGAVLMLLLFVNSQRVDIERQFDEYGSNIVILPRRENLTLSYGGITLPGIVADQKELDVQDAQAVLEIPNWQNIRAVSPKLVGVINVGVGSVQQDALLVGIYPEEEGKIKSWWDYRGNLPQSPGEALLGQESADKLMLELNETFELNGQQIRVSGILDTTGSQDDSAVMVPMEMAETLLQKPGHLSLIEVSALCSDCPIDEIVSQIQSSLPHAEVRAIRQVMDQRMEMVESYSSFAYILSVLISLFCGILIFTLVTSSVEERKKEIGILRAIGYSRNNIIQIIVFESILLSILAGIVGVALVFLWGRELLSLFTRIESSSIRISLESTIFGVIGLLVITWISSILPAIRAANRDPIESIGAL